VYSAPFSPYYVYLRLHNGIRTFAELPKSAVRLKDSSKSNASKRACDTANQQYTSLLVAKRLENLQNSPGRYSGKVR
jgi:hypothetical protein